ncbi:hypothetical protein [Gordonia iterans]
MGKTVSVRDQDVYQLISQAYQVGGKYQWAREGAVNSIQAEATWVRFGIEEQGFANQGVARRFIADNGVGMNEEDLRLFLSSFGGGGRTIGMGHNFGQGFKSSCYEWNPFGIVVVSWTEETPEGRMIWIYRDDHGDNTYWRLRDFQLGSGNDAEFEDCIVPTVLPDIGVDAARLKFPEIEEAGHGTVFLFLGDSAERETMNGDYLQGEDSRRGIVGYLNSRFIDIPDGVEIAVENFEAPTGSDARRFMATKDGGRQFYARRSVKGVRARIEAEGVQDGTLFSKHGTIIEWYLTSGPDRREGEVNGPKEPVIMVQYEDEAYEVKKRARDYRLFGVPDEVKDRLWLIIKPPKLVEGSTAWGVTPQASRNQLIAKGEMELPWDDWYETFCTKRPKPVQDAINETRAGQSAEDAGTRRERLKQVQAKFGSRWRPVALVESIRGRLPGNPIADGTSPVAGGGKSRGSSVEVSPSARSKSREAGGGGNTVILDPDTAGEAFGSERRKSDGIPEVVWDKEFTEEDERCFAARFDQREVREGSFGTVHLNAGWPMFQQQFHYWQGEHPRADSRDMEELVKRVYEDEVVSKVMHAHKLRNSIVGYDEDGTEVRLKREEIEQLTSPAALTAAVVGLVNVEQRIRTAAGSKFGPAASARKARPKKARR